LLDLTLVGIFCVPPRCKVVVLSDPFRGIETWRTPRRPNSRFEQFPPRSVIYDIWTFPNKELRHSFRKGALQFYWVHIVRKNERWFNFAARRLALQTWIIMQQFKTIDRKMRAEIYRYQLEL